MTNQKKLIDLCKSKGYNRFHTLWFEDNKLEPKTWYLELCLLQKWFREVHNIHMFIKVFKDFLKNETTFVCDPCNLTSGKSKRIAVQNTYEKALEKGLKEALLLIK